MLSEKTLHRLRVAAFYALGAVVAGVPAMGIYYGFHMGQWLAIIGGAAVVVLGLAEFITGRCLGSKEVG